MGHSPLTSYIEYSCPSSLFDPRGSYLPPSAALKLRAKHHWPHPINEGVLEGQSSGLGLTLREILPPVTPSLCLSLSLLPPLSWTLFILLLLSFSLTPCLSLSFSLYIFSIAHFSLFLCLFSLLTHSCLLLFLSFPLFFFFFYLFLPFLSFSFSFSLSHSFSLSLSLTPNISYRVSVFPWHLLSSSQSAVQRLGCC